MNVIANVSSGAPEKNVNDVWGYDLVTFCKLPNLTDRDLPHLDLPTSEKLANQGRINPRHCEARSNPLPIHNLPLHIYSYTSNANIGFMASSKPSVFLAMPYMYSSNNLACFNMKFRSFPDS